MAKGKNGAENVLWANRLLQKPEKEAFEFQSSIKVDKRLAKDDIRGSRAHASMLGKTKIIPSKSALSLNRELQKIEKEIESGDLPVDFSFEDIHSFVESVLTERLGDEGKMIHAGRSRNDQVCLDLRLYLKRTVPLIKNEIKETLSTLLKTAEGNLNTIMPGYTHLQRAQPVTLGFYLCAWSAALLRDSFRFDDALFRLDECPLGAGALSGSGLPLDRNETAKSLGFRNPVLNAMDAVADRDFTIELSSACAITMVHLSRFCEEIVIWSSEEFKFLELSESWSTGSSIMPQKKNPDFAELVRGKSARTTGNLVTLLTLLKGLPYSYNKDLQEDKEALFDSIDTTINCLKIFKGMIESAVFNQKRMKAACMGGFLEATDTAEFLVKKGLPFRTAHEVTAQVVRDCIEAGEKSISERQLSELKKRSKLFDDEIYKCIKPASCIKARILHGGTAPSEVRRQIKVMRKKAGI